MDDFIIPLKKNFRTIFSHNGRCLICNDFVSAEMMREAEQHTNLHEREHEHEGEFLHFFDDFEFSSYKIPHFLKLPCSDYKIKCKL